MKKKSLIAVLIISIICTACSSKPTEIQSTTVTDGENSEAQDDLNNNNDIEAEKYSVYRVKEKDFEPELLEELFLSGRIVEQKRESPSFDFDDFTDTVYECSDGSVLINNGYGFVFNTEQSRNYPIHWFTKGSIERERIFSVGPSEVFTDENLDFMTMEAAEKLVIGYLDKLKIDTGDTWEKFSLDSKKMTKLLKKEYPDEDYKEDIEFGYSEVKREYKKEDEVYLFNIPISVDGHDISMQSYYPIDFGYVVFGSYIQVMVGESGICYWNISNAYEILNQSEEQNIISENEALKILEDDKRHIIGEKNYKVEACNLVYISKIMSENKRDSFELIPAWFITIQEDENNEKETYALTSNKIINAITGEFE